jgi:hypothetical protein
MKFYGLIDYLPFWGLFAFTVVVLSLSYEGGYRLGRRRGRRQGHEPEVVIRTMVASMTGLMTFMLAFTFWIAATHFDAVRQAQTTEATAIGTVYLRADLLPDPYRAEIRNLLREYVDIRLEVLRSHKFAETILRSDELQILLWAQAVAAKEKTTSPIFVGYFIQSLNEMIALQTKRIVVGLEYRIPDTVWIVLYTITALASASLGCHAGLNETNRSLVLPAFILIFSVAIVLMADLDRPLWGALNVSGHVYVDLRAMMGAH